MRNLSTAYVFSRLNALHGGKRPDKLSRLKFPISSKTNLISALSLLETALQLIWSLILHYQIGGAGGGAKKMLLQWVNELLPDVKVPDLKKAYVSVTFCVA